MMKNFSIHPAFWLFMLAEILEGKYAVPIIAVASAIAHETGHAYVANNRGYVLERLTIMPYGAVLGIGGSMCKRDAVPIAFAGPLVSAAIALLTVSLWWIFPITYSYTLDICRINATLAVFNLLPVFPLDGGRIIIALSKKPLSALKAMRISGATLGVCSIIAGLVSFFYTPSYSLCIIGAALIISATGEANEERYRLLAESAPFKKNTVRPLTERTVIAKPNLTLLRLLKELNPDEVLLFKLLDESGRTVRVIDETALRELCLKKGVRCSVKNALR